MNGQMYKHEVKFEEVQNQISYLSSIRDFIKNRTIGISSDFSKEFEKYSELFHPATLQTFLNSKNMQSVIICDEFLTRLIFKNEFNIQSITSYHLIHYLFIKNKISKLTYNKCIYKLVAFGYEFIPFNCYIILQSLRDFEFDHTNIYFKSLIENLKKPITSSISANRVIRDFWNMAAIQSLPPEKRKEISKFISSV